MPQLWAPPEQIPVRRLGPDRLGDCLDLAADRGWPREDHKWRLLFEVGEVYGITDPDGFLVGTTVLTRYGSVCAVSMVLVARHLDGHGLGRRLMTEVIAQAAGAIVTLYATDLGRPLYEKLGFVTLSDNVTHVGRFRPEDGPERSRPATEADLPAILRLDAEVHGADRSALVRRLPSFCHQLRVVEAEGRVTGYAGVWHNLDKVVAGPVVAEADDAKALLTDLARHEAALVRLEVLHEFGQLGAWAVEHGLVPGTTTSFMVLGGHQLPGDASRRITPVSVALG